MPFGKHHIEWRVDLLDELARELDRLSIDRSEVVVPEGPAGTTDNGGKSVFRTTNMPYLAIGPDEALGCARVLHNDFVPMNRLERRDFFLIWPDDYYNIHWHVGSCAGRIAVTWADIQGRPVKEVVAEDPFRWL